MLSVMIVSARVESRVDAAGESDSGLLAPVPGGDG
jgi:hypothetical protein